MSAIDREWQTFLLAVQFLTRIPLPAGAAYSASRFADSVRYYPLVGLLLGAFAAVVYYLVALLWPPVIAALLSTAATILITGAFHEDGLADTFDGISGGLTPERSLEIMKDSRIGTFGMLAAVIVLATKVAALAAMPVPAVLILLIAAHALSRLSCVLVIATSSYARGDASAKPVARSIDASGLLFATASALPGCALLYVVVSPIVMWAALGGMVAGHLAIRWYFERKLGGYTGDCLGATQQLSETGLYLGALACL